MASASAVFSVVDEQDSIIEIQNSSRRPQPFALAQEVPLFQMFDVPSQIYISTYQASKLVSENDGTATFVMAAPPDADRPRNTKSSKASSWIYAVTGLVHPQTRGQGIEVGHRLFATDSQLLRVGDPSLSSCIMSMPSDSEPKINLEIPARNPAEGSDGNSPHPNGDVITIKCDHSFSYPNEDVAFIGIGAPNPNRRKQIIPLITWEAIPGSNYVIEPSKVWLCTRSQSYPGNVTDCVTRDSATYTFKRETASDAGIARIDVADKASQMSFTYNTNATFS